MNTTDNNVGAGVLAAMTAAGKLLAIMHNALGPRDREAVSEAHGNLAEARATIESAMALPGKWRESAKWLGVASVMGIEAGDELTKCATELEAIFGPAPPAPDAPEPAGFGFFGNVKVGNAPTLTAEEYPGLGQWWVQLRIGPKHETVLARVFADDIDSLRARANAIAMVLNEWPKRAATPPAGGGDAEVRFPATGPFVDRIVRIFRDRPHDDTSSLVLIDYANACIAASAPARVGQEWQSIETAPKDGTRIITFAPERTPFTRHVALNWFESGAWQKCNSACQPTHWMPVPEAPGASR